MAAAQTSPFLDLLIAGMAFDRRFDHLFNIGIQGGVFLGGRVRVAGRFILLTSEPDDDFSNSFDDRDMLDAGFQADASDPAALVYGGSIGFAGISKRNFVFSPGVGVMRSDESAYGTILSLSLPFEWVTDDGARFGFQVDVGRGLGGTVRATCFDSFGTNPTCDPGEVREFDRPAGAAFYSHFEFGWGFSHPPPAPR